MSALDALISNFKANSGTMPTVNPPAAAKVLETQTKPETEGKAEPQRSSSSTESATFIPAPAAGSTSEPAGEAKTRRTAAVVQAELDLVAAELVQTKAALAAAVTSNTEALKARDAEIAHHIITKAELEKAVEFAKSVVADNAKLAEQGPGEASAPRDYTVEGASDFLKTRGFGIFTLGGS